MPLEQQAAARRKLRLRRASRCGRHQAPGHVLDMLALRCTLLWCSRHATGGCLTVDLHVPAVWALHNRARSVFFILSSAVPHSTNVSPTFLCEEQLQQLDTLHTS